jgi:hypothetical protein
MEAVRIGLQDVMRDLGAVTQVKPLRGAAFLVLDCDRIAADRVQILGRVERPSGRLLGGLTVVQANPARNARQDQSLDRQLDRYLGYLPG